MNYRWHWQAIERRYTVVGMRWPGGDIYTALPL